jgi:hypothetical protein
MGELSGFGFPVIRRRWGKVTKDIEQRFMRDEPGLIHTEPIFKRRAAQLLAQRHSAQLDVLHGGLA